MAREPIEERLSTGSAENVSLANIWLSNCLENHSSCLPKLVRPPRLPTRVIAVGCTAQDVPYLYESGRKTRYNYVALSYCWGSTARATLKKDRLKSYKQALPVHDLPLTLRECIDFTRRLGFKYLWIDALCII